MNSHNVTNMVVQSIFSLLFVARILTTSVDAADRPNIVVIMVDDMGYSIWAVMAVRSKRRVLMPSHRRGCGFRSFTTRPNVILREYHC